MKMRNHRTTVTFSQDDLDRCNRLQEVLGTRNRSETLSIAVQMALALKTDPVATLAAAGVHFDSALSIDLADGKVVVKAYQPKGGETTDEASIH